MFPSLDPKKMQAVMKQMGIAQQEIDASKVIIEKVDGGKIIIEPASVTKIKMQDQESFQITGDVREESSALEISESDIKTVMGKTGVPRSQAVKTLEETGDLAEAILKLS
ncbi:Nascent polypeptide-associated complex protein [Candidatus Pacearchaeota archaeon]|nr:Nascent polypeptide-associated complex protein [Candidatus Pacearchaeota archaeon]